MRANRLNPALALRFALREMRGGLSGFYIFLACIMLGVAAIAAVNSVSSAVNTAIAERGREILAADIRFERDNEPLTGEERSYLDTLGTVSQSVTLRSMTRLADGSDQSLAEVKAVDGLYPLYGAVVSDPAMPVADALGETDGRFGTLVAPLLADRLHLAPGDSLLLGNAELRVSGILTEEPDSLSEGFAFAPRILISDAALQASGLVQLGSLVDYAYRIRLAGPDADPNAVKTAAEEKFPDAGWSVRTSDRAAPSLSENVDRLSEFLTLVGLATLMTGGVGIANAVSAFLESRRRAIAAFKCMGAPANMVVAIYFFQIMLMALIGIVAGMVLGAVIPLIALPLLSSLLEIAIPAAVFPGALLLSALFGLLTAIAFAILPLAAARDVPATALLREHGYDEGGRPAWSFIAAAALTFAILGGLAIVTAEERFVASVFLAAVAGAFVVLRLVAVAIKAIARRAPHPRAPSLRLAVGNIHRPGALTGSVVLSLGLGLTLLVALALIDGNLNRELSRSLPERAPDFFFVDIQSNEVDGFRDLIETEAPTGELSLVPMLRGRIMSLNGTRASEWDAPPDAKWVLRGDRGITYDATLPENSTLAEGAWWPEDYSGEPLVSFAAEEGKELGLKLGDTVTVNVLGRDITAKIASFRNVEWGSLSINFVMVFSPNTFAGAPHGWLATLTNPDGSTAKNAEILGAVTRTFPTVTTIEVRAALEVAGQLVDQLATAIRAAAAIALVASVLVLSGALAAGNRRRGHDAIIMKTLGATRPALIRAFVYEYLLLGLATGVFALIAGSAAAWYALTAIMELPFALLPSVALGTIAGAVVVTVAIGLFGTWHLLGQKPALYLREL
ncbi:ABC transporter permease [Martelella endophytica]|uniref:Glycosyl transferase family 1 n=1 Tax=Martelella endophytica TaxID=1486262 RepID=A0A0D5LNM9_MAREN|nr:ABC transporter permease [Martelella endophytica]AJY44898.1 glycosyl transferase family 1 [Martelella endophytica]